MATVFLCGTCPHKFMQIELVTAAHTCQATVLDGPVAVRGTGALGHKAAVLGQGGAPLHMEHSHSTAL